MIVSSVVAIFGVGTFAWWLVEEQMTPMLPLL